ncbi:MAG: type I DNA topoisomerase [Dehalococcoidia bacterium]|nr:type I DNA topoisomerase [Dehalococcoidia bacterium]
MAASTKTGSGARSSNNKKASKAKSTRGKSTGSTLGANGGSLVIVESPAKARTIERILGDGYLIRASRGHVRDLPKGKLGVDLESSFDPSYTVVKDKQDVVRELKDLGSRAPSIYLATDPDREGEAISWHLVKAADWDKGSKPLHRVVFHEITQDAVKAAFEHPRTLDMELVNAQQARRILDRLVGYQISPLLWKKVQRGLSAGRVQSVALRMVVDREKEIRAFVPREYWTIEARLRKTDGPKEKRDEAFTALLHSIKGQKGKLKIENGDRAREIEADLKDAGYAVSQVKTREVKQSPAPPFITSTLQQEAFRKLRFSAKRTMMAAQQLYEGVALGSEGSVGLITYMRTDSTNVTPASVQEARTYIKARFGEEYLPDKPRAFRRKAKGAQEAHEAIRPTSITRTPDQLKAQLSRDQHRLYDLIWRRMLASQMAEARSDSTTVETEAGDTKSRKTYLFRSTGSVLTFPGFRTLYMESVDDGEEEAGKGPPPGLKSGDALSCLGVDPKQHFTQPPPRYTEASLIKSLEEKGIGRPSTYAPIISTIMDRHYVVKEESKLAPTSLGETVCDLLMGYFTDIMDTNFTARMEDELDEVARGERQWVPMLEDFYGPFQKALDVATEDMPRVRVEEATDEVCDKCEKPMVIKMGRFGRFLSCSGFPECRNARPIPSEGNGARDASSESQAPETTDEVCEKCGKPMEIRTGRFGKFIACTDYPTCKTSKPILNKVGVPCPRCGGDLVQRRGRGRGRVFYGCSRYPDCDFLVNQRPLPEPCPECEGLMVQSGRSGARCTTCAWKGDAPAPEEALARS